MEFLTYFLGHVLLLFKNQRCVASLQSGSFRTSLFRICLSRALKGGFGHILEKLPFSHGFRNGTDTDLTIHQHVKDNATALESTQNVTATYLNLTTAFDLCIVF